MGPVVNANTECFETVFLSLFKKKKKPLLLGGPEGNMLFYYKEFLNVFPPKYLTGEDGLISPPIFLNRPPPPRDVFFFKQLKTFLFVFLIFWDLGQTTSSLLLLLCPHLPESPPFSFHHQQIKIRRADYREHFPSSADLYSRAFVMILMMMIMAKWTG